MRRFLVRIQERERGSGRKIRLNTVDIRSDTVLDTGTDVDYYILDNSLQGNVVSKPENMGCKSPSRTNLGG